jgi:hypothetical protein
MSLDANIILAGRAPQFDDPLTVQNRQATLSALMGRQQMQQFELEGAQRQRADEQTLADLYRSAGTDPQALMQGMAQQGLGARIPGFQEQQAKLGKATSENQAAQYKFQKDVLADTSAGLQSLLSDPQLTTDKAVAFLATRARLMPDQAQRLAQEAARLPSDPGMLRQLLLQKALEAQSAEKRLDLILGKTEMQDQGGQRQAFNTNQLTGQVTTGQAFAKTATPEALMTDARTRSEGAANRGVTMRGQNMTDDRTRESTAATMSKPFEVTGPDGLPMLVQQDKQGNVRQVGGYGPKTGSSKPLTDAQAKALLFGTRMQEANKELENLTYSPAAVNAKQGAEEIPLIGGVLGMVGNAMLPETAQRAEQAQRDFVNAVLRRESGAVISPSEFANAKKQYFPQPSDRPGTLAQKKRNRELAISGLMAEVPEGKRNSITPPTPATDAPAVPGTVLRFDAMGRPIP